VRAGGGSADQQPVAGHTPCGLDAEIVRAEMHAVRPAEQGDIHVVVDDEQRVGDQTAKLAGERQQLAASERLMAELDHVRSAADRSSRDFLDAFRRGVWSYDVEPGFLQPQLRIWRSFS